MGFGRSDISSLENDLAAEFRHEPGDGFYERRFSRSIWPQDADDLAVIDREGNAADDRCARLVSRLQRLDRKHG